MTRFLLRIHNKLRAWRYTRWVQRGQRQRIAMLVIQITKRKDARADGDHNLAEAVEPPRPIFRIA